MRESVIYQDILQKGLDEGRKQGLQQGWQQGLEQEARSLVMRLLSRRFGVLEPQLQERIRGLSLPGLEELGEALLDFQQVTDLAVWLTEHQP